MRKLLSLMNVGSMQTKDFEALGRFVAVSLGGFCSPTWMLLNQSLSPYINFSALAHAETFRPTMVDFMVRLNAHHAQLAYAILPSLILCLVLSIVYILLCGKAGELAVRFFMNRSAAPMPELD